MGRRCRGGPDRSADREDELSNSDAMSGAFVSNAGRDLYRDRCSDDCRVGRGGAGRFRGLDILEDAAGREGGPP